MGQSGHVATWYLCILPCFPIVWETLRRSKKEADVGRETIHNVKPVRSSLLGDAIPLGELARLNPGLVRA